MRTTSKGQRRKSAMLVIFASNYCNEMQCNVMMIETIHTSGRIMYSL